MESGESQVEACIDKRENESERKCSVTRSLDEFFTNCFLRLKPLTNSQRRERSRGSRAQLGKSAKRKRRKGRKNIGGTYVRKEREERTRARGLKSYLSLGGGHNSPGLFPSRARSPTGIF